MPSLKSVNFEKIKKGICPFCESLLKPRTKKVMKKKYKDFLVCHRCDIRIRVKDIINDTIPQEFNEHHLRNLEDELSKRRYGPQPRERIRCGAINSLDKDPYHNYTWRCLECGGYFKWATYRVSFEGDVYILASIATNARRKAYNHTGDLDCEVNLERKIRGT